MTLPGPRRLLAFGLAAVAAIAVWMITEDLSATLVALAAGVAAVMMAMEPEPAASAAMLAPAASSRDATAELIETIRTKSGRTIYDHAVRPPPRQQVIGTPALQYMNQMMREVVRSGTGAAANVAGYDLAGKTGTTSDYHDAWFDGFTGGFTTVVWMAGPEGRNMGRGVTGGGPPARAWKARSPSTAPSCS